MRIFSRIGVVLGSSTLIAVASWAVAIQDDPSHWTIDDVILAERARQWTVSATGDFAVWVRQSVRTVEGEEKPVANLWLSRLDGGDAVQLTRGAERVSSPAVSPDGRHVGFLSNRPLPPGAKKKETGKTQLWALPLGGGEPFSLTRLERDVKAFGWVDAESLVIAAQESPAWRERERQQNQDTAVVVDDADNEPPVRLFRVSLKGGKPARLTENLDWIQTLIVAPDGSRAVVIAQQSLSYEFDHRVPPHILLVDLADGELTRLFAGSDLLPSRIQWAPDSAGFYFVNEFTRHPKYRMATVSELWFHDLESGKDDKVSGNWDRGIGGDYAALPDGVVALLADGVRYRPARFRRTDAGWTREDLSGAHVRNLDALTASRDGTALVYRHSTATRPGQWYTARLEGSGIVDERQLTELNERFATKPTGRVEVVRWSGAQDEQVEGLLHYPLEWQEGRRYPLVLDIHGGPTGVDRDTWDQRWANPYLLWRQRGAFVLQVNYHGSSDYGLDWVESIGGGKYYDLEVPDIESGVDALIDRGLVDPERLATSGWSNGGILSAALITHTRRYKAASVGAADVEWISDWGNVDFGASFDNYYFGGPPWEIPDVYIEKSPFFKLTEVTTPTIVFTGTEDRNVPPHQSWSLFRAMQQIGKAPVRLVLFPGEPHGLRKIAHQRRKLAEEVAWFERYLFDSLQESPRSIQQGSLLQGLLEREAASNIDGAFGTDHDGTLIPEIVTFQGIEVGRFEVTRAQFAAFVPSRSATADERNLPVTDVSFEQARAYVEWLAELTGRPFRLPTKEEADKLAGTAGSGGNTLGRWAGYTPNPDDRSRILEALEPLGEAPLLLPVGSLGGAGQPGVFDLDGNVAEWAVGEDGGEASGPSADRSGDPASQDPPAPEYTGLRVLVGP